jgi:hypothetical protein
MHKIRCSINVLNHLLFVLIFLFYNNLYAQNTFKIAYKIEQKCNGIEVDELGNFYLLNGATVTKYNLEGNKLQTFSNNIYGNISSLSFNTSLKPTLFFKELGYIVQLDNTLSEQGGFKVLQNYGIDAANLLIASTENSFWFFDERNFKLKNINRSFATTIQSNNLSQITDQPLRPTQMMENNNFIYLNNSASGILIFDTYGSYIKTIPILEIEDFFVYNEGLFYVKNGFVFRYGLKDFSDFKIELPLNDIKQIRISKNAFFLRNSVVIALVKIDID